MGTLEDVAHGIDAFAKVEPTLAKVAGVFVPGAGPVIAVVQPFLPAILKFAEQAVLAIATKNGGDIPAAVIELMQHLTPGQKNSLALADSATLAESDVPLQGDRVSDH